MRTVSLTDKRSALFEKTNSTIWTDPYIQQQMLKEHLPFTTRSLPEQQAGSDLHTV